MYDFQKMGKEHLVIQFGRAAGLGVAPQKVEVVQIVKNDEPRKTMSSREGSKEINVLRKDIARCMEAVEDFGFEVTTKGPSKCSIQ